MEIFKQIIANPLFAFLFGSGGILVIVIAIVSLIKNKKENGININIDVNSEKKSDVKDISSDETKNKGYNLEFEPNPIIDKREEYDYHDFKSEDFYVTFLKTIEEKKKAGDKFEYK